ncbi:hypothetical protein PV396_32770 [Streptomyces sp. ME02-8801-2C]|uniref:hypothetical protein n=1 Tax=Streptomyces sp. ME02-8801-2C TaxID=3028680 RepID=UPI0029A66046|nr:hypothetical protein [Streptomyces sp. ME02-8801-2C]MDX3456669.1 hypothetical protein [Streptomyces sp. ME02-8801-2C]
MRRTTRRHTIRRHTTPALSVLALAIALAGCADPTDSGKGGGISVSPSSPTSASPSASASPKTSPTPGSTDCSPTATLGARDSGRTVCLAVGDTVRISLDGTSERPWKPLTASGSGLKAANSGIVLRTGDASAAFEAVSAGRTRLESTRPLCATGPDRVSCRGIQEWWVTVVVK